MYSVYAESIKHFCAFLPETKNNEKIKEKKGQARIVQLNITYSHKRAQVVFPKHIFIHKNRNVLPDKIVDFFFHLYNFVSKKKKVSQVKLYAKCLNERRDRRKSDR